MRAHLFIWRGWGVYISWREEVILDDPHDMRIEQLLTLTPFRPAQLIVVACQSQTGRLKNLEEAKDIPLDGFICLDHGSLCSRTTIY